MLLLGCTITCVCVNVPTIFLDVPLLRMLVVLISNYVLVFYISRAGICVLESVKSSIMLSSYNLSTFSTSYLTACYSASGSAKVRRLVMIITV